jgi:hypothetical protein
MKGFIIALATFTNMVQAQAKSCVVDLVENRTYAIIKTFSMEDCSSSKRKCLKARSEENRFLSTSCVEVSLSDQEGATPRVSSNELKKRNLLRSSDWGLALKAELGIGSCQVYRGKDDYDACGFYVIVGGQGYPQGSGCASSTYHEQIIPFGCNKPTDQENAGCLIRKALESGACFPGN